MKGAHWQRRNGQRPLVLGHRGARHAAPENTFRAFELAIHEGADGVELDVRLDADHDVIVLHDRTLSRVTGWHDVRDVECVGSDDLHRVDVGRGERVPRLEDVLGWAVRGGHRVNVEVKRDVSHRAELVRRTVAIVSELPDPAQTVILSSFHPGIVRALASALPRVPVAWLVHAGQRLFKRAPGFGLLGAIAVHPERVLATPSEVQRWKRAGALVNVWTVNDPSEARALSELGVDAIFTDIPREIVPSVK